MESDACTKRNNRQYVLRLWIPALLLCGFVGTLIIAALTSGDRARSVPVLIGVPFAVVLIVGIRWWQKRRIGRMFQAADPGPALRSFEASLRRMPHGAQFAAAHSGTILALYGRVEEAERAVDSVSWRDVPPLIQAQESVARATIAYVQSSIAEGLDHAVAGLQLASLDLAVPGAQTSELAFRTYRNLGLALSGRATATTAEELRTARTQLPLMGQILAAWGLAVIARNDGDLTELRAMQQFIQQRGPHLTPVLQSIGAANPRV